MNLNTTNANTFIPSSDLADLKENVFNNDLILKKIIKKLENSADLANCRLVNKEFWKGLATQRLQMKNWKDRKFLVFNTAEKIQEYCMTFADTKVSDLCSILFPCLAILYCDVPTEAKNVTLETIFRTFPQKMKSVDLSMFPTVLTPQLLNPVLESQSSSLEELRIRYQDRGRELTFFLSYVSSSNYALINLRYLCLTADDLCFHSIFDDYCLLGILELICSKIPVGNPNSLKICLMRWSSPIPKTIAFLKHYDLISSLKVQKLEAINVGDFKILAESGIQLEFLRMDPYQKEIVDLSQEICQFLDSQRNSLKMLEWRGEEFEFPATAMNLRKLKLNYRKYFKNNQVQGLNGPPLPVQHIPISYGHCFPKLEFLEFASHPYYKQPVSDFHSKILAPSFPCVNLQILKLRYYRINAETINLISEIFPQINNLDVGQYNDEEDFGPEDERMFYLALWSANFASTLEEFAITLDVLKSRRDTRRRIWNQFELDSFFSGLNIDLIQQLDFSSGEYYQIQTPSILNFTKLQKLEIFATQHIKTPGSCFTDFSAFSLFGQLKNLEYLHVDERVHEFTEIALEYLKILRENQVRDLTDDKSCTPTPTERIEEAFGTDWNNTNSDESFERISFNLLC